jgi:hypothetical protein
MAAVQTTYTLIRNMQLVHESCLLSESGSTREGIGDVWASTAPRRLVSGSGARFRC